MSRANAEAITPPDQTFPTLMLLILPVFPLIVCGRLAGFCVIQPVSLHHLCYRDRDSCATGFYYRAQLMKAPAVQVCKSCRRRCLKLSSLCVLRTLIKKVFHLIYRVGQKGGATDS